MRHYVAIALLLACVSAAAGSDRGEQIVVPHIDQGNFDRATAQFAEAIRLDPQYADSYFSRAMAWRRKGDLDHALADLNEAVRLDPQDALVLCGRGLVLQEKGDGERALLDFDHAIQLYPHRAFCRLIRASYWKDRGKFDQSLADYQKSLELDPDNAQAMNGLAWILATCPETALRDGARAAELAKNACELTDEKDGSLLDTLAAACAEAGKFEEAAKFQEQAMALLDDKLKAGAQERLELYRQGKPYREKPKKP